METVTQSLSVAVNSFVLTLCFGLKVPVKSPLQNERFFVLTAWASPRPDFISGNATSIPCTEALMFCQATDFHECNSIRQLLIDSM